MLDTNGFLGTYADADRRMRMRMRRPKVGCEPGKVAVVNLLLAVLPPLVAVVVRRKGIHLPHALLFPASLFVCFISETNQERLLRLN